ncbi:MAG TPA: methyltransferase domain-containing protein [Chloroflexota bacterium]|jgi:SAM-dependent methyltransferase|nr:methyltransferase domain-containing protein [Chloroflexota bacterium]
MTVPGYVFQADDRSRLAAAEELLDDGTQRVLTRIGVASGWRCLEVGAGGGSIARWLAGIVGSSGQVVATDVDVRQLQGLANPTIEIRQHDITSDPLETNSFDLIHARLVLEHLAERQRVLEKLTQALRPGGWLVVEAVDYVSAVPVGEHGAALHARTQGVRLDEFSRRGVDHALGRRLPSLLRAHGLAHVANEGRAWIMEGGSPGARWFKLSLQHLRAGLVQPGLLTDADVDRMLAYFDDPTWSAVSPLVVAAWGRRPPPR